MTAAVANLIEAVERAGGKLTPVGGRLRISAPQALPETIMAKLRAHKAELLATLAGQRSRLAAVPNLGDPDDIRAWLGNRAARHEATGCGDTGAACLAYDRLLWLWCKANPTANPIGHCAACGAEFHTPVFPLPDGAHVCDKPDYSCLITYGNGRRQEAVEHLCRIGIEPPEEWEL